MPTLRPLNAAELSDEERAVLERLAARTGRSLEQLLAPGVFGVQTHWPAWLDANLDHSLATYYGRGALSQFAKEAMHVGVSMVNHCEY
ncbi:MAG: hypothetical protein AB7I38_19190 [Dehalococcoidia bacterium]